MTTLAERCEVREMNGAVPLRDPGSVLQALGDLRALVTGDAAEPVAGAEHGAALRPARCARVEPSTGLVDVRAMAALVQQQVAARRAAANRARPVPAAAVPRPAPAAVSRPAPRPVPRPAAPAVVRAPAPSRLSPVLAFMLGVLCAAVVMGTSALVGAAWV